MNADKYAKTIEVQCPTCGGTQYQFSQGEGGLVEIAKCASCGREITKGELLRENSENVSAHVKEMGKEITKDIADQMRSALKNAFRGSKNITIK